jgi:hypothetical protein
MTPYGTVTVVVPLVSCAASCSRIVSRTKKSRKSPLARDPASVYESRMKPSALKPLAKLSGVRKYACADASSNANASAKRRVFSAST